MRTTKEPVTALLERLPNDASFEDVQYHLYVLDKVMEGLASVDRDGGLTQRVVEQRLERLLGTI